MAEAGRRGDRVATHFNETGNLDAFFDLLADDATMDLAAERAADRVAIKAGVEALIAAGWFRYNLVSAQEHGQFVLLASENEMRDGSHSVVAAVLRFNGAGKIAEVRQMVAR